MSFEAHYSFLDRLLHRIAFATPKLQIDFAEAEDEKFFRPAMAAVVSRPVFITAMPRSGTTLLLNITAATGVFAHHTYRDMPFLFTPIAWRRFSQGFQRKDTPHERAHGDGMMVGLDSPEAFEEMLWKAFWPQQYAKDRILPWPLEGGAEFLGFFKRHMVKLGATASADKPTRRYASKNNFNIARIGWLRRAFPDAVIIVPFREPVEHAASLLRQHLSFLELHSHDAFARDYMAGIGHFDFGASLKPIDFDGWIDGSTANPKELAFWLAYWRAAYGHCLRQHAGDAVLFDYDQFCAEPTRGLQEFAAAVGEPSILQAASGLNSVGAPRRHAPDLSGIDPKIVEECRTLHEALRAAAHSPLRQRSAP